MKITAAVATLILATLILATTSPAYANYDSKIPHPEGGQQTFPNGGFSPTRYSFSLHVTGRTLAEMSFTTPEGIRLGEDIVISDETGKSVQTKIITKGLRTVISFSEPINLGSKLRINLNSIRAINYFSIWELLISGKLDDLKEDISLQSVRMPSSH